MSTDQQRGWDFTEGAIQYVMYFAIWVMICIMILGFFRDAIGLGLDDTDESKWSRSGLIVYKDAKTGIEYLGDGHGLTPRLTKEGVK